MSSKSRDSKMILFRISEVKNCENKMLIRIVCIIVFILRILGLTFGGIAIDSKNRITTNKWFKLYGIIFLTIIIVIDFHNYITNYQISNSNTERMFRSLNITLITVVKCLLVMAIIISSIDLG